MPKLLLEITLDKSLGIEQGPVVIYAELGDNGHCILSRLNNHLRECGVKPLENVSFKITNTSSSSAQYVEGMTTLMAVGFRTTDTTGYLYPVVAVKSDVAHTSGCTIL
ncbi:hypothetical protein H4R18_005927 [Coemansia javaensis]|uniref:Uncharacterized protein n=1 Tax=Coemansia javaensis TaxID=2761396 RepID=A0A9W8H771_9FUNG|nr:hypothetical protein H4R18_005927 [Coemansia javaensis]